LTGYILNKVPSAKWLSANVAAWGIATACTAAAKDYKTLLVARIFLGIFEAAIAPSLMLISSQWYTKSEQAPRFAFWYCGLGVGQIIGGAVSFGFQHVKHPAFAGWRVMFVVLGAVTVLIGAITALVLPDTPMSARFLSNKEKAAILHHVAVNQTGVKNTHFKISHVIEVLLDVQLWMMTLITILVSPSGLCHMTLTDNQNQISISSGVITTYSATLIRGFGYSSPKAALLNMPSGVVSIASTLIAGYGIRYVSHRWAFIVFCCLPGIMGGALMAFLPKHNQSGLLAGIYLVNFVVATLVVIYHWTAANVAGHTKRVVSMALISGSFSVGNIIGPQTFQAKDAPQYVPAKITVLATQGAGALVTCVLFLYYTWANKRKDRVAPRPEVESSAQNNEQWENLTDKENKFFRYVY
jgi:MFS family permease